MAVVDTPLDILIGDTFLSDRWAVVVGGAAVDLTTGWTVQAQIRARPGSATVLHDFTPTGVLLGSAQAVIGGVDTTTSTIQLHIPPAVTATFDEWVAVWDVQITHPTYGPGASLYRRTIAGGRARTRMDVTR